MTTTESEQNTEWLPHSNTDNTQGNEEKIESKNTNITKGNGNTHNRNKASNNHSNAQSFQWKGKNEEIKAIIGLKSERYEYKVLFSTFNEHLKNYIAQHYKFAHDLIPIIDKYKDPKDEIEGQCPEDLTVKEAKSEVMRWIKKAEVEEHMDRRAALVKNKMALYSLVWGQCTIALQEVIKGETEFEERDMKFDIIWLLQKCKVITSGMDERANAYFNLATAIRQVFNTTQRENETNEDYRTRFESQTTTMGLVGGKHILTSPTLLQRIVKKGNTTIATDKQKLEEEQKMKAMIMIIGADHGRFATIQRTLRDGVILGRDEYPETVTAAYDLLQSTCPTLNKPSRFGSRFRKGGRFKLGNVSFVQLGEKNNTPPVPGTDGIIHPNITCHGCNAKGHYRNRCPTTPKNVTLTQFVLNQHELSTIDPTWILLDTCSTVSVFCNKELVTNITPCAEGDELHIITNGGSEIFKNTASLNLLPLQVHFNPASLANILSLSDVANLSGARVTMDTSQARAITLHYNNKKFLFQECQDGLYYYDTNHNHSNTQFLNYSQTSPSSPVFIQSVANNKLRYTHSQIEGADRARKLQAAIGWPSTPFFKHIVQNNLIRNCNITPDDISRAINIYGPPTPLIQGKSTRTPPKRPNLQYQQIPLQISTKYVDVKLYIDFFYVNSLPFLHTKSADLNFLTVQSGRTRNTTSILQGLQIVLNIYHKRGFKVTAIYGDNEFNIKSIIERLRPILFHIYAAEEHCAIAERSIRTIKESCRSTCHSLPFKKFTKLMVYSLVETAIYWLNSFPTKNSASDSLSSASIVLGRNSPDQNNKYLPFGSYTWVQSKTTNTMKTRRIPCIALGPCNEWGSHSFMSLYTGKKLHAYEWTTLPIDEDVIARVEELATAESQPKIINNMPLFEWGNGNPISDEDDEPDRDIAYGDEYEMREGEILHDIQQNTNQITVDTNTAEATETQEELILLEQENEGSQNLHDEGEREPISDGYQEIKKAYAHVEEELDNEINEILNMTTEISETNDSEEDDHNSDDSTNLEQEQESQELRSDGRPKRKNAGKGINRLIMDMKGKEYYDYNHSLLIKKARLKHTKKQVTLTMLKKKKNIITNQQEMMNKTLQFVFAQQMSAKKGIKQYGERAVAAILKEFTQLHNGAVPGKPVVEPVDVLVLTSEEKRKALEAVNLIAEKRCGTIKGRTCANGSTQRRYLRNDESVSSPTVSLEALLCSLIIDAHEGRDVVIFDVPGAYLHAPVPPGKMMLLKLRGDFVDIMCQVSPIYKKYIHYENNKKVLYLKILRALYGCIESALLWYNLFSNSLEKIGFQINPYDRCVANKVINNNQCTIVWYVDDVKVSHIDNKVVDSVIKDIERYFGPMKVSRDETKDYLGMNITITKDKFLEIEMKESIKDAIQSFEEEIHGTVTSPTPRHLFQINDSSPKLNNRQAEIFHSVTAKLLYLEKRARPDIETAVAFLTTRVSEPTIDDWKKLKRVLTYLSNTINDIRRIGCDSLSHIFTWIDAAFAVHPNMRSQTGGTMSFGWGVIHAKSTKQKLNTKSSTESELVGISEYLPYNIWLINFLKAQGYVIKSNILYQDNESTIRMAKNGRNSCTGNSRHVDIRYFFVKDRVEKGEISVLHCPTHQMLADFFTKSLQGKSFYAFKNVLMGWKHINSLKQLSSSSLKERVEKTMILQDNISDKNENKNKDTNERVAKNTDKTPIPPLLTKSRFSKNTAVTKCKYPTWDDTAQNTNTIHT